MSAKVVIRPAIISEHGCLEALQTRASLGNLGDREWLLAHPDVNELPVGRIEAEAVFVAEQDGEVVGFAAILSRSDGGTDVDALFVEPDRWRHGIGRLLVDHCETVARSTKSTVLHVIGNIHAEGFYRRCGFERVGTVELPFGIGIVFQKDLRFA